MKKIISLIIVLFACTSCLYSMETIPNEVVCMFFEHLTLEQRKSVARVCSVWNFFANTLKPSRYELLQELENVHNAIATTKNSNPEYTSLDETDDEGVGENWPTCLQTLIAHLKTLPDEASIDIQMLKKIHPKYFQTNLLHMAAGYNAPKLFKVLHALEFDPGFKDKYLWSPYECLEQLAHNIAPFSKKRHTDPQFEQNWCDYKHAWINVKNDCQGGALLKLLCAELQVIPFELPKPQIIVAFCEFITSRLQALEATKEEIDIQNYQKTITQIGEFLNAKRYPGNASILDVLTNNNRNSIICCLGQLALLK